MTWEEIFPVSDDCQTEAKRSQSASQSGGILILRVGPTPFQCTPVSFSFSKPSRTTNPLSSSPSGPTDPRLGFHISGTTEVSSSSSFAAENYRFPGRGELAVNLETLGAGFGALGSANRWCVLGSLEIALLRRIFVLIEAL